MFILRKFNGIRKMKKLVLHIGHHKTGTSFIQSILAINKDRLINMDALYPQNNSFIKAQRGRITGGNGDLLLNEEIALTHHQKIIYSRESFFDELINGELIQKLLRDYKVCVILYSRDLFSHSFSRWGQQVKRRGCIDSVDDYLCGNPDGPYKGILDWILLKEEMGFELIFRNYSRIRNLKERFLLDCFDINKEFKSFEEPKSLFVNRSLSAIELEIQRLFNSIEGSRSRNYISDLLVEKLPGIKPKKIKCSEYTYDYVAERLFPVIKNINSKVPIDENIRIEPKSEVCSDKNTVDTLSNEQLVILKNGIKKRFGI